jgi:methionyl-tRNA synthetase
LFVWALVHVAELMAHEGRYVLPENFLCNEFYELENQKFSTSMGHVVWARDLVSEVPRDVVRFYLCRTAPEHAKTNFSRAALDEVVGSRLTEPWNELSAILASLTARADDADSARGTGGNGGPGGAGGAGTLWPVSPQARAWAAAMMARFSQCFELSSFSLNRAAELVTQNLERLLLHAQRAANDDLGNEVLRARIGDLFLQLRALITCAAPILIDLAARTAQAGDFEFRISADAFDLSEINAFPVPRLSLRTASAGDNGLLSSATTTV